MATLSLTAMHVSVQNAINVRQAVTHATMPSSTRASCPPPGRYKRPSTTPAVSILPPCPSPAPIIWRRPEVGCFNPNPTSRWARLSRYTDTNALGGTVRGREALVLAGLVHCAVRHLNFSKVGTAFKLLQCHRVNLGVYRLGREGGDMRILTFGIVDQIPAY